MYLRVPNFRGKKMKRSWGLIFTYGRLTVAWEQRKSKGYISFEDKNPCSIVTVWPELPELFSNWFIHKKLHNYRCLSSTIDTEPKEKYVWELLRTSISLEYHSRNVKGGVKSRRVAV